MTAAAAAAAVAATAVAAVRPDRDEARAWAERELSGREYQAARPGPLAQALRWLRSQLDRIPAPHVGDLRLGVAIITLAALAVVVLILWRSGGLGRNTRARQDADLFGDRSLSAADHRAAADAAEEAGDLVTALVERFRAVLRALADRDLVQLAPGRTADEVVAEAGTALPELTADLLAAARAFDDVRYGDRPVTPDQVRAMRELDGRAAAARPASPATSS